MAARMQVRTNVKDPSDAESTKIVLCVVRAGRVRGISSGGTKGGRPKNNAETEEKTRVFAPGGEKGFKDILATYVYCLPFPPPSRAPPPAPFSTSSPTPRAAPRNPENSCFDRCCLLGLNVCVERLRWSPKSRAPSPRTVSVHHAPLARTARTLRAHAPRAHTA